MPVDVPTEGGLSLLDDAVVGVYLVAMLGMGFYIARRQRSTDDFFLGGRRLPAWAVGISLFASLLSTITYLGMPGEMFRTGVAFLTRQIPVPIVLLVVWFVLIPFFMRLKLTSAYEYLERRFNYATRAMAAVFCLLLLFGWMSVVVLTAAGAMVEIANLNVTWFFGTNDLSGPFRDADMHVMILSIGLFSVLYTAMGGMRAVVWTDVIQFLVLMIGALFTMGAIAWSTHSGVAEWLATSRSYRHETVEWFNSNVGDRSNVTFIAIGMMFWFVCTHGANQVALQRYFSVGDIRAARRTYLVSAIASLGIGIILAGVGIALMHFIQRFDLPASSELASTVASVRQKAPDKIFPQFIRYYLPDGLRGMVVAALFAAAMSTIDSGANSVTTIVTIDFFRRFRRGPASASSELTLARCLTATMGLVIVASTWGLYHLSKGTDIITLCQKGFNCFLGPLGGLFTLAMFSRRATARTVLPALLIGEVTGVCASYSQELFGIPFSTHLVIATSWLVTIATGWVLAVLFDTCASDEQQRWMWLPIVRSKDLPRTTDARWRAAESDL